MLHHGGLCSVGKLSSVLLEPTVEWPEKMLVNGWQLAGSVYPVGGLREPNAGVGAGEWPVLLVWSWLSPGTGVRSGTRGIVGAHSLKQTCQRQ